MAVLESESMAWRTLSGRITSSRLSLTFDSSVFSAACKASLMADR